MKFTNDSVSACCSSAYDRPDRPPSTANSHHDWMPPKSPFCEKCGKIISSTYIDRNGKWRHVSGYLVGDGTPPASQQERNKAEIVA